MDKIPVCPEPSQRPDLWPWGTTRNSNSELMLGGISAAQLAGEYGTPNFFLNLDDLSGRAQVWVSAMDEEFWEGYGLKGAGVYYAAKAFMCGEVVRRVSQAGMGIDTASEVELRTALAAGADPTKVGLHGNNKSQAELELAVSAQIGRIVIDSPQEVARVQAVAARLGKTARVMVRLVTGVHAGGHDFIATAHEDQKFGISLASGLAEAVVKDIVSQPNLQLVGLHSHIGSQIFDLQAFGVSARKVLEFRHRLQQQGISVPEVDLGGGYAISYRAEDAIPPTPQQVAQFLAKVVVTTCKEIGSDVPFISIEPGRSVIGPTTITLYSVGTIKDVPLESGKTRRYVSVDGGMSDNIRPALYQAQYTATLANRRSDQPLVQCRVVGKHCESGDIVVYDVALPADLKRGDLLAVPATGAYGYAMSSNYNMARRPGVIGITQGQTQVLYAPETTSDLLSKDLSLTLPDAG